MPPGVGLSRAGFGGRRCPQSLRGVSLLGVRKRGHVRRAHHSA